MFGPARIRLRSKRARTRSCISATLGVALAAVVVVAVFRALPARVSQNDFAHYYVSSRLWLEGTPVYGHSLSAEYARFGFTHVEEDVPMATNPPGLVVLFAPFSALPPATAYACWQLVQCGCLLVVLGLTLRLLPSEVGGSGRVLVCGLAIASPACFWHFYFAQVQLLLAALILGAFALDRGRHHHAACSLIALAGWLKIFPLVLLPWFVLRPGGDRVAIVRRGCAAAVVLLTGLLVTGPRTWFEFQHHARGTIWDWAVSSVYNYTVPAWLMRLGYIASQALERPALFSVSWAVAGGVGFWMLWRGYVAVARARRDPDIEFSLLCILMVVAGLTAWIHYFVLLIYPLTVWAVRLGSDETRMRRAWGAMALICLFAHYPFAAFEWHEFLGNPLLKVLATGLPLYGLLAVAWALARRCEPQEAVRAPSSGGHRHAMRIAGEGHR